MRNIERLEQWERPRLVEGRRDHRLADSDLEDAAPRLLLIDLHSDAVSREELGELRGARLECASRLAVLDAHDGPSDGRLHGRPRREQALDEHGFCAGDGQALLAEPALELDDLKRC